jgi:16S rRNA processing protein RimM
MNNLLEWNLTVGEIVAPFGLAGEMKVRLETDFPERFARLKQVCIRTSDGVGKLWTIAGTRQHKGQILLKLTGISRIEDAEPLRNCLVQIKTEDAVSLPENEFYIHSLVGCDVKLENGKILGKLSSILRTTANDVYVIGKGKEEILLPAIKDVVKSVDLDARTITVSPTPGLLPDDPAEVVTNSETETDNGSTSE